MITIKIENSYECGHQSSYIEQVESPGDDVADLDVWLQENQDVTERIGDGHACGASENALYEVTVIAAPEIPQLVGMTASWG